MFCVQPLLVSQQAASDAGEYHCISLFEHAINLRSSKGNLLTLHRYNKGLSPFGYLLRSDDFDWVYDHLAVDDLLLLSSKHLQHPAFTIQRQARLISCLIPEEVQTPFDSTLLMDALIGLKGRTGLFGDLHDIVQNPLEGEMLVIQQNYLTWLAGDVVDWKPYIGKGAGLTPSHDDTLIGMLFAFFMYPRIRVEVKGSGVEFMPTSLQQELPQLTTYVSVAYYQAALAGCFSMPLLRLAYALHSGLSRKVTYTIGNIAKIGHTSGVDTLLGIWLAVQAIEKFKNKHSL